ncbi:Rib/alpha-like domain-containing protein, partial [Finegoldia sp. BIOML-A1]|uniref:Rib/alpha-like domain-containing protein n=1 Tax=Finegoldia sp. BIOML-A1 TaxID=2584649 RepID=UPI0013CD7395|nr:hypothetical protein [Finegoldia sp. BIOML-A1]
MKAPIKVAEADNLNYEPDYKSVVAQVKYPATVKAPKFLDKENKEANPQPTGMTFAIEKGFTTKGTLTIDDKTGAITYTAVDADKDTVIEVPVIVTYADGSKESVKAIIDVPSDADFYDPQAKPLTTEQGTVPKAEDGVEITNNPPEGTTYTWEAVPKVNTPGETTGTVKVTYPDGTEDFVEVPVTVTASASKKTTVDDTNKKPVDPTGQKQGTGIIVTNPDEKTTISAKDANGKDVTPVINKVTGEIEVTPGTDATGPITVTVTDSDLPEGKKDIKVPVAEKSAQPGVTAPTAGDQTISGTGVPGSKITLAIEGGADSEDTLIAKDVVVGQDEKWTAEVPAGVNLNAYDIILATQTEQGKSVSDQTRVIVKKAMTDAEKNDPEAVANPIETEVGKVPEARNGIANIGELDNVEEVVWLTNPDVSKVADNVKGTAVVVYKDGSTDKVEVPVTVVDSRKDNEKNPAVDPAKTEVKDKKALTDEEKAKVEEAVKKANPEAKTVTVGDDGKATLTYEDGSTNEIPGEKIVTETPKQCLTPEGLKEEFKPVIEEMFDGVKGKDGVYEGKLDSENEEVVVTIKDPSKKAVELKGTGLATGLEKLFKENNLVKIKVGSQLERDLKQLAAAQPSTGMTLQQLFATIFGTDVLNEVQKTGDKTGTLADFIGKEVKIVLSVQQEGCTEFTNVVYTIKGIDGSITPAEEYQAIFNGNGGNPTTQKVTVKDGEVVSGVTEPTREGYKFVKWVKLGTNEEIDLSKPFSKDILGGEKSVIFTAVWEKVEEETPAEEYQAIFNGNGGNPTTQKVTVKDGEVVSGVTEPTREGYKFVKWVKLGTNEEIDLSKPFSKDILGGEKSVIFTAVWEKVEEETPAEEYQAIFNGNGGNPTTQKVTVKDGEVVSGVTEPTREGYKFVKWVKLGTNEEIDLSEPFNKDILGEEKSVIFTAVWEKVVSENGGSAIFYPKETHPIFKVVGDELTEEEIQNAIVVLGLDKSKYTVTINEDQVVPTTDKPGDYIIDVTINFEDGTTDNAQVIVIVTGEVDTTAPKIDAGNITAVEGQPIPPVMVDVDDVNAEVTVEGLPEGLKYNPETKQIEGTVPKAEDWGDKEGKTITATIKAVDEAGNESTKEITVKILRDTDGDGTPDVTDTDDDNDGVDDKTEEEKGTDPKDKDSKPSTTAESTDPTIPEKTGVKDPEKLTDREKEEVKNKIEEANKDKFPEGTIVDVDDKGNATITYPDGSKDTIPAEDLVFEYKHGDPEIDDKPELPISDIIEPTVPGKTDVGDKDNLTNEEKEEIKDKIEEANKDNFPDGTIVDVDDKGNVTITYPDESTDIIPADKVVEQKEEVDKAELQKEVDKADTTKESDKYKNAD